MNTDQLPPLPRRPIFKPFGVDCYSADQMRAYAARAVAAERERCAKVCDTLAKDCTGINARLAYRYAATEIRGEQANT